MELKHMLKGFAAAQSWCLCWLQLLENFSIQLSFLSDQNFTEKDWFQQMTYFEKNWEKGLTLL